MYILTQSEQLENSPEMIKYVHARGLEDEYLAAGYRRYDRSYTITLQSKDYILICMEFRSNVDGVEPIIVIPEILIPRRRYAVYVYLYAIHLYSSNPGMGQREAAKATRERFGLITFSHTTLGRALKAFALKSEEALQENGDHAAEGTGSVERSMEDAGMPDVNVCSKINGKAEEGPAFPATQATKMWRSRAAQLLAFTGEDNEPKRFVERCIELARRWFRQYGRLLL